MRKFKPMQAANIIKSLRQKRGITQSELARLANTSRQHISRLELGLTEPLFVNLIPLVEALDYTMEIKTTRQCEQCERLEIDGEGLCGTCLKDSLERRLKSINGI